MKRNPVEKSSMFKSVAWDQATKTLEVEFLNGGVYQYDDFTLGDWREWCAADSKGSHFGKHIRGRFPARKIEQEETGDGEKSTEEGQET
jgi:hypothetical protein